MRADAEVFVFPVNLECGNEYLVYLVHFKHNQRTVRDSQAASLRSPFTRSRLSPTWRSNSALLSISTRATSAITFARSRSLRIASISFSRLAAWFNCNSSKLRRLLSEAEVKYSSGRVNCAVSVNRALDTVPPWTSGGARIIRSH